MRLLCLLFLLVSFKAFAEDADPIAGLIQRTVVDTCDKLNKPASSQCDMASRKFEKVKMPKVVDATEVLHRCDPDRTDTPEQASMENPSGANIPVSALSLEEAQDVFQRVSQQKTRYAMNDSWIAQRACAQRAQLIAVDLLKECRIQSGKIFVRPSRSGWTLWMGRNTLEVAAKGKKYSWDNFHVANIIYVKDGDKSEPYVLDPLLFDRPVPLKQWEALVKQNDPGATSILSSGSVYKFTEVSEAGAINQPSPAQALRDLETLKSQRRLLQKR